MSQCPSTPIKADLRRTPGLAGAIWKLLETVAEPLRVALTVAVALRVILAVLEVEGEAPNERLAVAEEETEEETEPLAEAEGLTVRVTVPEGLAEPVGVGVGEGVGLTPKKRAGSRTVGRLAINEALPLDSPITKLASASVLMKMSY
jgi:hypothetical protein